VIKSLLTAIVIITSFALAGCTATDNQTNSAAQSGRFPPPEDLTRENLHQFFVPGRTTLNEVRNYLGTPSSVSQSGDQTYWNYTIQTLPGNNQRAEMRTLTLVFSYQGVLQDADLQVFSY